MFLKSRNQNNLPPSPPALPVIGHLHLIGPVLAKSFQTLATHYGPLMQIRLGASTCVVASNAVVAKEIFKTQDLNFSSRPEFGSSEYFIYRGSRFVTAQYGDYWRFMKKLCMTRLLSFPQLDKFTDVLDEEKVKLVESVNGCAREGKLCDLNCELTAFTNNTICRMTMSTRCSGSDNDADQIERLVKTCLQLAGKLSLGDILGPFRIFDFSGNGKKLVGALQAYDRLVERVLQEHEEKAKKGFEEGERKDLMDILLEIYNDPAAEIKLSKNDIKSFLLSSDEKIGEHKMEYKGQNFRYLPFGSGRRGCPGATLAMMVMHAAVGALVQCFDWKVKDGKKVDLTQGPGFRCRNGSSTCVLPY
ncbi:CYTOCHROME P450 FAMILY 712 SUBFAMILY A POLYPEPTIDE 1 [Salix koriyanagi]|uniref:CYTOCHROME P450 FAMILY 712 SUBFAMILY A POLYPEPTIDE 1 n=1 Tax=Salix koriyanagi TaxID=2511006 RepID=A0A9Q0VER6_9ROSI|nr:CYTOCHROME P450 FAMILY 712 SUBFAMILY A POLYPEPTIDE 1 [Salix koriyanagi]